MIEVVMVSAAVELGSKQKECEVSPDESASQVPLPELVGGRHSARSLHSVRTAMAPWQERQHRVRAQRTPSHSVILNINEERIYIDKLPHWRGVFAAAGIGH